jgi:[ribosomal protein S18]-alanine N-acetyltransferase
VPSIRPAEPRDLAEIRAIQAASPHSAQWDVTQYWNYQVLVAVEGIHLTGFLVARTLAEREHELLNLAVAPDFRRRGIGRALVAAWLEQAAGTVYLEVRPSNTAARLFYKYLGFEEINIRPEYYQNPPEPAIVLKFHSC